MAYEFYNPNPCNRLVGDCTIRAITKVLDKDWETIYMDIAMKGFEMCDMPSSNAVWGAYLQEHGFKKKMVSGGSSTYTIKDFSNDNPEGTFVLSTGTHVVALINGTFFDAGDSGMEIIDSYWEKVN